MNFKKFISGVSALTIAASAFAGMAVTVNAAAGDVTTNADITFANTTEAEIEMVSTEYAGTENKMVFGTGKTSYNSGIGTDGNLYIGKSAGTVTIPEAQYAGAKDKVEVSFDLAFGKLSGRKVNFYLRDKDGEDIANFEYDVYNDSLTTNLGVASSSFYHGYNTVLWARRASFDITINYATKKLSTKVTNNFGGDVKNYEVDLTNTDPMGSFVISSNYENQGRRCAFNNLLIKTTEGDYTTETCDVTYAYETTDGAAIAASELPSTAKTRETVTKGESYTPSYEASFMTDDYAYTYASGGDAITVNEDTTVTIKYTKVARNKVTVTVNGKAGSVDLGTLFSKTNVPEGNTVYYGIPKYVIKDGTLYQANTLNSNNHYAANTVASSTALEATYTAQTLTEGYVPVYFKDFGGDPETTGTGYQRASGGNTAGTVYGTHTLVESGVLPAGIYKVELAHYKNRAPEFFVGETKIGTCSTFNNGATLGTSTFENVTINAGETVSVRRVGNSATDEIDYILLIKTADIPYAITKAATENGSFTVSAETATEGTNVTITPTADSGYEVDTVSVATAAVTDNGNGTYSFTMPASDVTVSVAFKAVTPAGPTAEVTGISYQQFAAADTDSSSDADVTAAKVFVEITGTANTLGLKYNEVVKNVENFEGLTDANIVLGAIIPGLVELETTSFTAVVD